MRYGLSGSWIGMLAFTVGVLGELVHLAVSPGTRRRRRSPKISFRRAIVGFSKHDIARRLGPPPAATMMRAGLNPTYWTADAWYYPFDPLQKTAVAVLFRLDRAVGVEFIPTL